MIDLGSNLHYLSMEVNISVSKVVIMQKTYMKKLLHSYQMSNCNFSQILRAEKLILKLKKPDFTLDATNVIAYKKFKRFFQ